MLALWLLAHLSAQAFSSECRPVEGGARPGDRAQCFQCQRRGGRPSRRFVRCLLPAKRPSPQSASRGQPGNPASRPADVEARDSGRGGPLGRQRERRHPRRARRRARRPVTEQSQAKGNDGQHEWLEERRPLEGQGARRDHRRGELRQLAPPGGRVLQGCEARGLRSGAHARRPRRVPHLGHRVHRRLRRRQGQGRRRPRRRDLGEAERHDQVRDRAEDRHQGLPRHDARRHRQVHVAGRREGARARPTTSSGSSRRPARTSSSTTSPSAPSPRRSGTRSRSSRPASRW